MNSICTALFADFSWTTILVAAVAQHFFSFFWYAKAVAKPWQRLHALDKGVTNVSNMIVRYDMFLSVAVSFCASILRGSFVFATLNLLKLRENAECLFCAHIDAALLVALVTLIGNSGELWGQRHVKIQLMDIGCDLISAIIAASVIFYLSS